MNGHCYNGDAEPGERHLFQSSYLKPPVEVRRTLSLGFTRVVASFCSKTLPWSVLMGCQEELLIEKVYEIYDKLSRLENLNPSKQVNSLFTQFVQTCMSQCHRKVFSFWQGKENTFLWQKPVVFFTGNNFPLTSFPDGYQTLENEENEFQESGFLETNKA
jgi:hypothetical protein